MLMSFSNLVDKYSMTIHGVLHGGCHLAEEAPIYRDAGITNVTWIEANPAVLPKIESVLREFPTQRLIHALLAETDGEELTLNITNYDGMSSSVLAFGTHPQFSPDTVFVDQVSMSSRCIDSLAEEHGITANLLNLDLQGFEGPVLRGAAKFLEQVEYIITEVNCEQVYVGATQIEEIDTILADFERVETYWVPGQGWGDCLMIRR